MKARIFDFVLFSKIVGCSDASPKLSKQYQEYSYFHSNRCYQNRKILNSLKSLTMYQYIKFVQFFITFKYIKYYKQNFLSFIDFISFNFFQ